MESIKQVFKSCKKYPFAIWLCLPVQALCKDTFILFVREWGAGQQQHKNEWHTQNIGLRK